MYTHIRHGNWLEIIFYFYIQLTRVSAENLKKDIRDATIPHQKNKKKKTFRGCKSWPFPRRIARFLTPPSEGYIYAGGFYFLSPQIFLSIVAAASIPIRFHYLIPRYFSFSEALLFIFSLIYIFRFLRVYRRRRNLSDIPGIRG